MLNSRVVWIQPVVAHLPQGGDIIELGAGGGGADLERDTNIGLLSREEIESFLEQ